jgi:cephalosporin-C deacetylase-like acetyl esterase
MKLNSNTLFYSCAYILISLLFSNSLIGQAPKETDVLKNWIEYSDAPNSLYHNLASKAYQILDDRKKEIESIQSLQQWKDRQQAIQKTLLNVTGPFPAKTPLHARTVKTIGKKDFKVEHIIYESQPGFFVTSSLYLPKVKKGKKSPAVIYCSGHADEGYRSPVYQRVILNLVKKGFVVYAFDPVCQGERMEYLDPNTGKSLVGENDEEHSYSTSQAFLIGSSQARYMIWDGIRAIDYLVGRKEVDASQIGMTGRSGGGTQTAYIAAIDERIKAAAPECYITSYSRMMQSIGPQDGEQNLYAGLINGIDHADFLEVRAPKPALVITTTRDMFNIQGARETVKEVSKIYEAYGKSSDFGMVEDDAPHASTKKNRESLYAFFQQHLNNPGSNSDDDVDLLTLQELQVTKTGQVTTSLNSETIFSLNAKEASTLIDQLNISRANNPDFIANSVGAAKKISGFQTSENVENPVFTGRFQKEGYVLEKYFVKGSGIYIIPYVILKPDHPNNKALLYLHPEGKSAQADAGGEMEYFVKKGFTVYAPDLIGVGEMGPGEFKGDSYIQGISYNVWFVSMLVGKSIVGTRASDVVLLTQLIGKNKDFQDIYSVARKQMAPVLIHAAAFEKSISRIALIDSYISYESIVKSRFYQPAFLHSTVAGALISYDLPDLLTSIAPRKLLLAGITDGENKLIEGQQLENELKGIKANFHRNNADKQLEIKMGGANNSSSQLFENWIQ